MSVDLINEKLKEILSQLDLKADFDVAKEEEGIRVNISGDELGILIGYHGETLYSLQTILNLANFKETGEWKNIIVDVNGYRGEREAKLTEITQDAISRVRFLQKEIELSPMNSSDRRIVHLLVSKEAGVGSESTGEGYGRRVVIKPE